MNARQYHITHGQSGVALLMFVLLIASSITVFLLATVKSTRLAGQDAVTDYQALNETKLVLLGYAVHNPDKPGTLPCPSINNNGDASGTSRCDAYIAWLPWKKLNMPAPRDNTQQCLWYALSPNFREPITVTSRTTNPINPSINGSISVTNGSRTTQGVIAVIFAPNRPLSGQRRGTTAMSGCASDNNVSAIANYLDSAHAVNNATGNVSGTNYTFVETLSSGSFNDRLLYIKSSEFYALLRKRIALDIIGKDDASVTGLYKYYQDHQAYPCPSTTPTSSFAAPSCVAGQINYVPIDSLLYVSATKLWLVNNGWQNFMQYRYLSHTHVSVTIGTAPDSYTCDLDQNNVRCSAP